VGEIAGAVVGGGGPAALRREVFEELDTGTGRGLEAGDPEARAEDGVEPFLFDAVVLAGAGDRQPESVTPERERPLGVGDDDGRVVDAEEELSLLLPARLTLACRIRDHLERVAVGVLEVEGRDAAGVRVPVREALRPRGGVADPMLPEACVGLLHVGDDDGDVLERAVVAAGVGWSGAPRRRKVFSQLDPFAAEGEARDAHADGEEAGQMLDVVADELDRLADLLERQDACVEVDRAVEVAHGEPNAVDRLDAKRRRRRGRVHRGREESESEEGGATHPHARRSFRWSPTLSAFAMMVRAGFTAALEGKKLPSTT
jgi:hypothetical protein